ncbi:MAG: M56 family metallopeptidase, partial [Lewinella sp.]|nr:M56 family metallopeptidase [Lewinella sp.]
MSLTQYLLEFSICLAVFYALYYFLLRPETYFQLNRLYLLLTPLLAMIIPFLDWQLNSTTNTGQWDRIIYPLVTDIQEQQFIFYENLSAPASDRWQFTYLDLLLLIYACGMLWMAGRLMYRTWRLMRLIGQSSQESKEGYTVITPDEAIPAASFLSYVFWQDGPLSPERQRILEHELVHVRQWHSLDVLLMEVWVAVKWFHPMIYWYRNSLRLTHEYIADAYVSARNGSRLEYARLLTTAQATASSHTLLHHFNSSIKMRLMMLAKQPSRTWKYLKFLTILPVTALLMLFFSFNLAEELPDELVDPLAKAEQTFNGLVNQAVLPKTITAPVSFVEKDYKLKWGDIECN